jgi:hypothetical protein
VIRLKRKPDNNGWLRFNLDGTTEHQCAKKNNNKHQQQPTITSSASTGAAASSSLELKLDRLIAEVQALKLEVQKTRK